MSERRCDDCLAEFAPNARVFAVIKDYRFMPFPEVISDGYLQEEAWVCEDCVGWYGDDAIELEADELPQSVDAVARPGGMTTDPAARAK